MVEEISNISSPICPKMLGGFATPVAIVGGSGYLGSAICKHFDASGIPFWVVGRENQGKLPWEFRSSQDLPLALDGARTIIHLASLTTPATGELDPSLDLKNIEFTIRLAQAGKSVGCERIIFASSGGTIYGELPETPASEEILPNPSCSYGISKLASEFYLRNAALGGGPKAVMLRISNLYGGSQHVKGDQGVISFLMGAISDGREFRLWGNTVRDYIHIDDVARAFLYALRYDGPTDITLNVSTGIGTSLVDLVEIIARAYGRPAHYQIGARRLFDLGYNVLDNHKIRRELGWSPRISIEEGLLRTISHANERSIPGEIYEMTRSSRLEP